MAENFEAKFACDDLDEVERRARSLGAAFAGELVQEDVYFRVPRGRLKLRIESAPEPRAELIRYDRADSPQIRLSRYERTFVDDPSRTRQELTILHGEPRAIVRKRRRLYLVETTRIHVDQVEELGSFVEIEVVRPSGAGTDANGPEETAAAPFDAWAREAEAFARRLAEGLNLDPARLQSRSYADLLESKRGGG